MSSCTSFAACNEPDSDQRRRSEPLSRTTPSRWTATGRSQGTKAVPASGGDAHDDVARYAWRIVTAQGHDVMEGRLMSQSASMMGVCSGS
jgi:hypothetical protein